MLLLAAQRWHRRLTDAGLLMLQLHLLLHTVFPLHIEAAVRAGASVSLHCVVTNRSYSAWSQHMHTMMCKR